MDMASNNRLFIQKLGDNMRKNVKKKEIDQQLLNAIFFSEREWKQLQSIVKSSIEPSDNLLYEQGLSQAKYMFLLREARHRKVSAIRY